MNRKGVGRLGVAAVSVLATAAIGLSGAVPTVSSRNVVPKAGAWKVKIVKGGSGSGAYGSFTVKRVFITVSANHKQLRFSFAYEYSGPIKPGTPWPCSGSGSTAAVKPSAIKNARFYTPTLTPWTGGGSATFNGVFDSARKAHGTAKFGVLISGTGCWGTGMSNSGTATWKATR